MDIRKLGYEEYKDYLNGPEWKEIKSYFYENCGPYECRICRTNKNLTLHHRAYKYATLRKIKFVNLYLKFLIVACMKKYMVWLCWDCHKRVHYKNGVRVDMNYGILRKRENWLRWWKLPILSKILEFPLY